MNFYVTEIKTFHNERGRVVTWAGPGVFAIDQQDAVDYCKIKAPHVKVIGRLVLRIDEYTN